jgi:omega-6 fatty acid desaturase (delta-12 desaturase)
MDNLCAPGRTSSPVIAAPARADFEIVITVLPLVLLWVLTQASLDIGYWFPAAFGAGAGFFSRAVVHDSARLRPRRVFHKRVVNDWVGRVIGVVT